MIFIKSAIISKMKCKRFQRSRASWPQKKADFFSLFVIIWKTKMLPLPISVSVAANMFQNNREHLSHLMKGYNLENENVTSSNLCFCCSSGGSSLATRNMK